MSKNSSTSVKAKRFGPAAARVGMKITTVEVDLRGFGDTYKVESPRRHRGPSTARAVSGVSCRSKNKKK